MTEEEFYIAKEILKKNNISKIEADCVKYYTDKYGESFIPSNSMKIAFIESFYKETLKEINIEEFILN